MRVLDNIEGVITMKTIKNPTMKHLNSKYDGDFYSKILNGPVKIALVIGLTTIAGIGLYSAFNTAFNTNAKKYETMDARVIAFKQALKDSRSDSTITLQKGQSLEGIANKYLNIPQKVRNDMDEYKLVFEEKNPDVKDITHLVAGKSYVFPGIKQSSLNEEIKKYQKK